MQLAVDITFSDHKKAYLSAQFSIRQEKAHIAILFGPSGSGKSTLLHAVAGIATPTAGAITHRDTCWFDAKRKIALSPQARSVGLLFQDYSLFPHLTVFENIAYGLAPHVDAKATVTEWLTRFRLKGKETHFPRELSGGEQQRVALAQTLAPCPPLVLLDEPFSALDRPTRKELLREVRKWLPSNGISAMVVLHNLDDAICLGDELIVIGEGRVLQQGKPEEMAYRPASPFVAEAIGFENLLYGQVVSISEGEILLMVNSLSGSGQAGSDKNPTDPNRATLCAVGSGQIGDPYYIAIRADDILLEKERSGESSARNRLFGKVIEVTPVGLRMAVRIDCGFQLTAKITKKSLEELNLKPETPITAVIKASSIHLIPR